MAGRTATSEMELLGRLRVESICNKLGTSLEKFDYL